MTELEHFHVEIAGAEHTIRDHPMGYGQQLLVRFPNRYGASVVSHWFSYGVELAVLRFDNTTDELAESAFELAYDTPITSDVVGYLTPASLITILKQISELPLPNGDKP